MSDRTRQIKDPIYGYIYLPDVYVQGIIDTPEFQRLRKITQTSYEALYPSATHNRFAHSLGVYHLASIVADTVRRYSFEGFGLTDKQLSKYAEYLETYELASLLHDVGHAPFSHTSEDFYLKQEEGRKPLHQRIAGLTGDARFVDDAKSAAAHELMSVIVAILKFGESIGGSNKLSFFARAITGYPYKQEPLACNEEGVSYSFLNVMISLLNSKVIDVDRLDYLIRDAFQTGYESINLDYQRLLKSIRIKKRDGIYERVFSKDALSVLENAVYAHDAEKKWIQTHLSICYETYLLENAIRNLLLNNELRGTDVFCEQSLSQEGISLPKGYRIRLLSDGDIMFLLKNYANDFAEEYLNRKCRKHPLWKTEHEYKSFFTEDGWTEFFKSVSQYDRAPARSRINEAVLENCREDVLVREQSVNQASDWEREKCQSQLDAARRMLKRVEQLKAFASELKIPFDFVILRRKPFESGFNKKEFSQLKIEVRETGRTMPFCEATDVLSRGDGDETSSADETYYLFMQKPSVESSVSPIVKFKNMFAELV